MNWKFWSKRTQTNQSKSQQLKLITSNTFNSFSSWSGDIYDNDLIRSIVKVKARTVAKSIGKHIRNDGNILKVNPEPYMRFLLEEPNPIMTMQQLLEKAITQLELDNNAFIYINRDINGYPIGLYPIIYTSIQVYQSTTNEYALGFELINGGRLTVMYEDLIHLRQDYHKNELFGSPNHQALKELLNVQTTLDQGIIKAIKNSNLIQWLLKYHNNLSPDDLKKSTKQFVDSFLNIESTDFAGAASIDNKMDAERVEPKGIMPQSDMQKEINKRIYSYFNTNEKIIQSDYNENEWIAFFESCIEPILKQLSDVFTRKLFTRKERAFGNKIVFEGSDLAFASMRTKLALVAMVDRGALNPNEWRGAFNMAPVPHGDEYLLRKDTGTAKDGTNTKTNSFIPESESSDEDENKLEQDNKKQTHKLSKGGE